MVSSVAFRCITPIVVFRAYLSGVTGLSGRLKGTRFIWFRTWLFEHIRGKDFFIIFDFGSRLFDICIYLFLLFFAFKNEYPRGESIYDFVMDF